MSKYASGKIQKQYQTDQVWSFHIKKWSENGMDHFVHVSEFEPKQPQLEPKPNGADAIALRNVRTDRTETAVPKMLLQLNPFTTTSGSTTITVKDFLIMVDLQVIL